MKTYKVFMVESSDNFDLPGKMEKIRKELKGNKYLKSIIMSLGFNKEEDVAENVVVGIIVGLSLPFIMRQIGKFFKGILEDYDDLKIKENWREKSSVIFKIATKLYVVAILLNILVPEIQDVAKGNKEVKMIGFDQFESEIKKIQDSLK